MQTIGVAVRSTGQDSHHARWGVRACALLVFCFALVDLPALAAGPRATPSPKPRLSKGEASGDVLLVSEDDPWSAALAAPVVAELRRTGREPLVIVVSNPPTREAENLLALAAPRRVTVLAPSKPLRLGKAIERLPPDVVSIGSTPSEASLRVAKRFWRQSTAAVLAADDDPEGIILGSGLAAGLAVPLLIRDREDTRTNLTSELAEMGIERVMIASGNPEKAPAWARSKSKRGKSELLGPKELQHRLIETLGAAKVRSLVLARVPESRGGLGRTAWLAPLVSVRRGCPIVLTQSASASAAETEVAAIGQREGIRLQTVLVLADYVSIGQCEVRIEVEPAAARSAEAVAAGNPAPKPAAPPQKIVYVVHCEPCIPRSDRTAGLGVGRIPLESLSDTSVLFARGILRERLLAGQPPRLLMVANSGSARRALPLCETVSRATAAEFKNRRVEVTEFYGRLADDPEVLAAARSAQVIIYEGHLAYQDLIDVPYTPRTRTPDTYFEEELDDLEEGQSRSVSPTPPVAPPPPRQPSSRRAAVVPSAVAAPETNRMQGPLSGLPIVVLQSCDSLEEPVLWRIDELGGVAVIGSVTPIHSGSGSALIHAAASRALYGGNTLGESLRDAQNYLLCLEDLKARRGHMEQGKGRRVAMSFRLWGDPELRLFPREVAAPILEPVAADWTAEGSLSIRLPTERLAVVRSNKYSAAMPPGSQAGAMVAERPGETLRQVTPVYYFRVPLPERLSEAKSVIVRGTAAEAKRVNCRVDTAGKWLHVVYFPEKDKLDGRITLTLVDGERKKP